MRAEMDESVRTICEEIGAVLAQVQEQRGAAMNQASMKFGMDFSAHIGGGALPSAPPRTRGGHQDMPQSHTAWKEDDYRDLPEDLRQYAGSGGSTESNDHLVQALGVLLRNQGQSQSGQQARHLSPDQFQTAEPEDFQRMYNAVQGMHASQAHPAGPSYTGSRGHGDPRHRSQHGDGYRQQDMAHYQDIGGFNGHLDSYGMGGDVDAGMSDMPPPGNFQSDSLDRHLPPMPSVNEQAAYMDPDPSRQSSSQTRPATQSSGYVVKNTFIEPAEDQAESEERVMRASAVLFRSEQGLRRKQRYPDEIMQDEENEADGA